MSNKQPTSLVKFADIDTAIQILSDSSLRWSAPCLFQDPFELNHESSLNFDSRALLTACVKSTMGLIFSRDDPKGSSPLIKAIRRWRSEERFDNEEEAQEVLTELLTSMVQNREPDMLAIMREWKQHTRSLRILSLAEKHDNAALWDQYANRHTGIAIRLACGDETSLPDPQPVRYSDNKPEITSLAEQMDILMNQDSVHVQDSFAEKFLCKSKSESKDREWRLLRNSENADPEDDSSMWFEELPFHNSEVRAIYFGAKIEDKKKQELEKIIQRKFRKAKLFQAVPQHQKFELEFERLNGS